MIPTSILPAQIVISLKSKITPNIKLKNINVTTNINKSRFLSITFFSFTPPTQTSTAHTATHTLRHKHCDDSRRSSTSYFFDYKFYMSMVYSLSSSISFITELCLKLLKSEIGFRALLIS